MKQIAIIFLGLCLLGNTEKKQTPNEIVLNHAISCIGKKVGDGICETLVDSCLSIIDKEWREKYNYESKYILVDNDTLMYITGGRFGKRVSIDEAIPGDIIMYLSSESECHSAVVYEITNSFMFLLDQNAELRYDDNCHVGINTKSIDNLKLINATFFRPY